MSKSVANFDSLKNSPRSKLEPGQQRCAGRGGAKSQESWITPFGWNRNITYKYLIIIANAGFIYARRGIQIFWIIMKKLYDGWAIVACWVANSNVEVQLIAWVSCAERVVNFWVVICCLLLKTILDIGICQSCRPVLRPLLNSKSISDSCRKYELLRVHSSIYWSIDRGDVDTGRWRWCLAILHSHPLFLMTFILCQGSLSCLVP